MSAGIADYCGRMSVYIFVSGLIYDDIISAIVVFVSEPCLVGMLVLVLGLNADERRAVSKMLKKISKKFIK